MMKRLFFNKKILVVLSLGLALTSCKKYLDINDNPNSPTDQNITPELIFPQAEEAVGAIQGVGPWGFVDNWIGYFAANGDFARDQQQTSYNIDFSFSNGVWATYYNALFDLHQVEVKGLAKGDTAIAGASMILSAKLWQELVDAFGNIPYSNAFDVVRNPRPAYDDAKAIYNNLQLRLDTAMRYVQVDPPPSFGYEASDIINQGDPAKWMKFANILKLRMLIRQSQVTGFDPSAELAKINNPANGGLPEAGDSFSENPGYVNDVNKQNPTFATLGYTSASSPAKQNTSTGANSFIVSVLYNGVSDFPPGDGLDPRIERFFQLAGGDIIGNDYGASAGDLNVGSATSYFGPGLIGDPNSGGTYTDGAKQNQWILPDYESLFIEAEAAERGWIDGDAKTLFEAAITQSFVFLKVKNSETGEDDPYETAQNYIDDTYFANWDQWQENVGSSTDDLIQLILIQKYIANTGIDPLESWSDERRLGMLETIKEQGLNVNPSTGEETDYVSFNPSKVNPTIPIRLLYPQSEYTTNSANAKAQGTVDQFASKIFWIP